MIREYLLTDYNEIKSWCKKRGLPTPSESDLPAEGYIDPCIAAAFLVQTDTSVSYIDFMISDPDVNPNIRKDSLNEIIRSLIIKSGKLGYKYIKCDTQLPVIKEYAFDFGFKELGMYEVFQREC